MMEKHDALTIQLPRQFTASFFFFSTASNSKLHFGKTCGRAHHPVHTLIRPERAGVEDDNGPPCFRCSCRIEVSAIYAVIDSWYLASQAPLHNLGEEGGI